MKPTTESDIKLVERLLYAPECRLCESIEHRADEDHHVGALCPVVKKLVAAWDRIKDALTKEKP